MELFSACQSHIVDWIEYTISRYLSASSSSKLSDAETPRKKTRRTATPPISEDEQVEPPSFSLATLGLQRVGTAPPPKPQPQQPIQMLNARGMPARIRKPNPLFFDENIINDDKPLRMSLSPRKTPLKPVAMQSPSKASPSKLLRKRKGVASRYMRVSIDKKKSVEPSTPPKSSGSNKFMIKLNTPTSGGSTSSISQVVNGNDKRVAQMIGLKLRNLLKLPKAHKWVISEWFYSFIDEALFGGKNEFEVCVADLLPKLATRQCTRYEWRVIRSMIGKPRRCSAAFFAQERRELERRRQKIRYLQTRKSGEIKNINFLSDLPEKIPLQLPLGTKVTARLRRPQDGIFSGTVAAFDSQSSSYRVAFDRPGLGTHSIPDYEIMSDNFFEMLPLQSIVKDFRPHMMGGGYAEAQMSPVRGLRGVRSALHMKLNKSDPLLGQEVIKSPFKNPVLGHDNINGFPMQLLETLLRLKRVLVNKATKLQRLREMNNEAELKMCSQQFAISQNAGTSPRSEDSSQHASEAAAPQLSEEFQRRYASIVISMERMNRDMQEYFNTVQSYSSELSQNPTVQAMMAPTYLREKCREQAADAVRRNNHIVKNKRVVELVKGLSAVLYVASHLGSENSTAQVAKVLEGCMEEVKSSLAESNIETFQKNVQIHLHHIRLGIGQSMMAANANTNANVNAPVSLVETG